MVVIKKERIRQKRFLLRESNKLHTFPFYIEAVIVFGISLQLEITIIKKYGSSHFILLLNLVIFSTTFEFQFRLLKISFNPKGPRQF